MQPKSSPGRTMCRLWGRQPAWRDSRERKLWLSRWRCDVLKIWLLLRTGSELRRCWAHRTACWWVPETTSKTTSTSKRIHLVSIWCENLITADKWPISNPLQVHRLHLCVAELLAAMLEDSELISTASCVSNHQWASPGKRPTSIQDRATEVWEEEFGVSQNSEGHRSIAALLQELKSVESPAPTASVPLRQVQSTNYD